MDFAGIVDIALPVIYVLVGAVLVWFVVELALTIRSTRSPIDAAHKELPPPQKNEEKITAQVDPLIAHVDALVTDQIDPLLTRVNEIAGRLGVVQDVYMRITPGVEADTHEYIRTGCEDSKFGFTMREDFAFKCVGDVLAAENVRLVGLHCHIG